MNSFGTLGMAFRKASTSPIILGAVAGINCLLCSLSVHAKEPSTIRASSHPAPLVVRSACPLPGLTEKFNRVDGWTGADAAWSVPVSEKRTIWFFGDTWIGKVRNGKHVDATMINNTVGVQSLEFSKLEQLPAISFYWRTEGGKPSSFWGRSEESGKWLWPGGAVFVEGNILQILHGIKKVAAKEPDFGFAEEGDYMNFVMNPGDEPSAWKAESVRIPDFGRQVQFGNACFYDGKYFYSFCTYRPARSGVNQHPVVLARVLYERGSFANNMRNWESWCTTDTGEGGWVMPPHGDFLDKVKPIVLFADAAPEMSVTKVPGISGFVAIYMAAFQPYILMRHAPRLEGPWSAPLKVYKCPEERKKLYVYAAKAHPELARNPGELVLTYCRNTKLFADQVDHSDWYAPQAVRVFLREK